MYNLQIIHIAKYRKVGINITRYIRIYIYIYIYIYIENSRWNKDIFIYIRSQIIFKYVHEIQGMSVHMSLPLDRRYCI